MTPLFTNLIAQFGDGFTPPSTAFNEGSDNNLTVLSNLESLLSSVIGFFTILGGIFFIVYFLIGAMEWVTSAGDSGKLSSARNRVLFGIIGLVILVSSYAIIGLIGGILGLDLLSPAVQLQKITPSLQQGRP